MIKDGLTDAFNNYHMGITAENVAKQYSLTREEQDLFAAQSQQRAAAAIRDGAFKDEISPVSVAGRKGVTVVSEDEYPKPDTTLDTLAKSQASAWSEGQEPPSLRIAQRISCSLQRENARAVLRRMVPSEAGPAAGGWGEPKPEQVFSSRPG